MMSTFSSTSSSTPTPTASPLSGVQKVVVVNSSPEILSLAERALAAGHYDVVFVEAIEHAYSQIRRVQPNLVVLCLRMGDRDAFQVLSMLKLDPETRRIPVLTYTADDPDTVRATDDDEPSDHEFFAACAPALMN
jgi:CheY-like chemotaxis protein